MSQAIEMIEPEGQEGGEEQTYDMYLCSTAGLPSDFPVNHLATALEDVFGRDRDIMRNGTLAKELVFEAVIDYKQPEGLHDKSDALYNALYEGFEYAALRGVRRQEYKSVRTVDGALTAQRKWVVEVLPVLASGAGEGRAAFSEVSFMRATISLSLVPPLGDDHAWLIPGCKIERITTTVLDHRTFPDFTLIVDKEVPQIQQL